MQWLNTIVDELVERHPDGEILIESGSAPSGAYHLGHLREPMISDAILQELRRRGRKARHVHFVDDLDAFRKVPHNVSAAYEKYLGMPLCDIPAPDGSGRSYADYCLQGLIDACEVLGIDVEFIRSHDRYRSGWLTPAIEQSLEKVPQVRHILESIAGRQLDEHWTPIQVMENSRLKNRRFISIDEDNKTLQYEAADGSTQTVQYDKGEVKLNWRLDWPARWWLLGVHCEPSGRDHTTKGGSYDTGVQLVRDIFETEPPLSVAYDFINLAGDTKKMSASKGTGLDAVEVVQFVPPEVMRFFVFRAPPQKRLYFDPIGDVIKLMDEFAAFAAKTDRTKFEEQLLDICTRDVRTKTVSRVPFSHLVISYQAALKDVSKTLDIIRRTEHAKTVDEDADIIKAELQFIDAWLQKQAPEEVKFELQDTVDESSFNDAQKQFLVALAEQIAAAPADADGAWFHQAIYDHKEDGGLAPKELFSTLYQALIGKDSGPRAGWFLSILPRDWLIKRLKLEA